MDHLRCVVERITYQNAQNGYSVIKCRVKGYSDLVTVVGSMPDVHVGSVLELGGSWRVDPKYGRQFSMETFEETLPATVFGIEKYLGSGLIKGIGPKYAKKIVQEFGKDTLEVIETDPDRLNSIPGIGKMRVEKIKQSWQEQKEIKNIMLFLQGHDVSTSHATKIYKQYGNDSIEVVKENPYRLADDGHCYATRDMLLKSGSELLSVEDNVLSMTLDEMIRANDVITEDIPDEKLVLHGNCTKKYLKNHPNAYWILGCPPNEPALYLTVQRKETINGMGDQEDEIIRPCMARDAQVWHDYVFAKAEEYFKEHPDAK